MWKVTIERTNPIKPFKTTNQDEDLVKALEMALAYVEHEQDVSVDVKEQNKKQVA
jgi:hypothetical protein